MQCWNVGCCLKNVLDISGMFTKSERSGIYTQRRSSLLTFKCWDTF